MAICDIVSLCIYIYTERFDLFFMDIFIIALLLLMSALFSASETAFSTAKEARIRTYAQDGNKRAKVAIKISENYDKALTTVLIGNNIVNLTASSITTAFVIRVFKGDAYVALGTAVITVLVLIFGEIMPKNVAKEYPERFCLFISYPLWGLMVLFTPLVWLLVKLKNLVILIFGGKNDQPSMTEEELKLMIDEIEDEGVFDESESDLVKSAIEFSDISVSEILIPRVNIAAVEIDDDIESIKEKFISSHFSRLPVYEKTIDSIVGIIHEKYFFDMYLHGGKNISEIMQKPLYIFGLTAISDIMKEMQRSKSHMAIVVDQYGGTQGIVTMEDIIEELVGEIYDETDEEDTSFVDLGNGEYEVSGDLSIRDFLDKIGLPDDEIQTDCTSIGGLTMESLDHVPQSGEQVQVSRFLMKVISADEQKIDRVHISVMEKPEDSDSDERERDRDKDSDKEKDKDRDKDRDRDKDKDKDKSKDKDRDRDRSDKPD